MTQKELKRTKPVHAQRYLPGLDGFRAIAVIAIIIFHLNPQWLPGGFLGVDTFFVISGFLITSLLITEYDKTGKIDLPAFWLRRVKRLIPAVLFMLAVVLTYTLIFEPSIILALKKDAIAAIFYVSNWWYIAQDVDYFNQFSIAPLKHLWSLAIEEQFYLFFPFILYMIFKFRKRQYTFIIFFIVSLISLALMIYLSSVTSSTARVYFGTDTRLQTLLLGAMLALVWPPFRLKVNVAHRLRLFIDVIGVVSFALVAYFIFNVSEHDKWIYHGGFYLISFVTLFTIASVVHPSGFFAKFMGNPLFVAIGKRSYSLYLWHYPVIVLLHRHFVAGQIPSYVYVIDIVLMFLFAELSYRFIENPIRKKGFRAFSFKPTHVQHFVRLALVVILAIPSLLFLSGQFDALGKAHSDQKQTEFQNQTAKKTKAEPTPTPESSKVDAKQLSPLLIGDSVMVDIGNVFQKEVPNATIDGKVGRQLSEANALITSQYQSFAQPKKDVVMQLGTNGAFTEDQVNQIIDDLGDANIYFVNVRVPRDYEQNVNDSLKKAADKHKNVHLIDWHKASGGHPEYFAYDGVHLEYAGQKALSKLIIDELKKQHEHDK